MSRPVHAARFALANGWTLSICPDVRPAICSVAAWPTGDTPTRAEDMTWFKFASGDEDKRCWNGQDIIDAFAEIAEAKPKNAGVFE